MPRELWLALSLVALLALIAVVPTAPPESLLRWGVLVGAVGLTVGLVPAAVYHYQLARTLSARQVLPARWYWNPTALHQKLLPDERGRVLVPFYVGGFGFLLTCAGFVIVGIAVFRVVR